MLLSVVIPAYNEQDHLESCVISVLAAIESCSEILIIDDGSTDNSPAIARSLAERHAAVHMLQHPGGVNRGVAATRNLGLTRAAGKYISFIDADDFCEPTRFRESLAILEKREDLDGVLVSVGVLFGTDASPVDKEFLPPVLDHDPGILPDDFAGATLQGRSRFHISNLVFRQSLLKKSGGVDPHRKLGEEDLDFWLRVALCGRFCVASTREPQIFYRRHAGNNWNPNKKDVFRDLMVVGNVLRWAKKSPWVSGGNVTIVQDAFLEKLFFCFTLARSDRMFSQGMRAAWLAGVSSPQSLLTWRYWSNVLRLLLK